MEKFERQKIIIKMINGGMSYRQIGKILGVSKTLVMNIKTIFYKTNEIPKSTVRKCVLCGGEDALIEDRPNTICNECFKKIKQ